MGNLNEENCTELKKCCAPLQLLNQEVQNMNGKLDEISTTLKLMAEKQTNPEISKAWLIFWGTTITSGTAILVAIITNFDKIKAAIGG